jgi:hypothetical protein
VSLQRLGEQARQAGDVAGAASLTNEAQSLDEAAKALAAQYPYIAEQASTNKAADESATTFDLDGRRRALVLELQRRRAELDPSPGVAAAAAQRDRRHAERLALCIALFGASIFLLTIAGQLGKRVLPHVALIAALMLVATSVLTVVMW